MITEHFATHFAQDWIEAWNAHDLDRILEHYTDDFEMNSPLIISLMDEPSGTLKGKANVRAYWAKALERQPELHFTLKKVTFGVNSLAIHFQSQTGRSSIDWCILDKDGTVTQSFAHHTELTF